jgi:hypothetical protein
MSLAGMQLTVLSAHPDAQLPDVPKVRWEISLFARHINRPASMR